MSERKQFKSPTTILQVMPIIVPYQQSYSGLPFLRLTFFTIWQFEYMCTNYFRLFRTEIIMTSLKIQVHE